MIKKYVNMILHRGETKDAPVSLDRVLEETDRHLENLDAIIPPAPESRPRTPFDANLPKEQMSMMNFTIRQQMQVVPKMVPLMVNMQRGAHMYHRKFKPTRSEASPEFMARLESLARAMGARDIGYVKVPRNAIFKGKGIPAEYAIVFTVEMDREPLSSAPSFECQVEVMDGYRRMARISLRLARYMRRQGFAAYPGTALGGLTDYPHLAELAGLGAIGYHGLLISPGEGARLRINTIYTNITNLPTLEARGAENEHLWVRDFCAMCKKCVRACPAEAIFEQPRPRGDAGMQTIDHAACREYFTRNYGCAVCLVVCPFSQAGYAKVQARFKGNPAAPQFRIGADTP
jgi:epoxyqueuosine reductase